MEETRIWLIEDTLATQLDTANRMDNEGFFEDILSKNPDMLEEGLQLIGRQTPTDSGKLDLLGVTFYGKLVVFELKRDTLHRDAVAQVINYASDLDAMDSEDLYELIAQHSGNYPGMSTLDNFETWYSELLANSGLADEELQPLMPPRMVLVGLGVDDTTEGMVNFMARSGMDISLLTFQRFEHDGKTLLSRNLDVDSYNITVNPARKGPNPKVLFDKRVQTLTDDMRNLLTEVEDTLKAQVRGFTLAHSGRRMNFRLRYSGSGGAPSYRATLFVEIDEDNHGLKVGFHPIAIQLAPDDFQRIEESNFPPQKDAARNAPHYGGIDYEAKFPIPNMDEWNKRKKQLTALTQSVFAAYQESQ